MNRMLCALFALPAKPSIFVRLCSVCATSLQVVTRTITELEELLDERRF